MSVDYVCDSCGASGVKLWREYQTFADQTDLLCARCAGKAEGKDVSSIDADGRRESDVVEGTRTDQIGWMVPAITTVEGDTFWGYTSVPPDRVSWWTALPSLPT